MSAQTTTNAVDDLLTGITKGSIPEGVFSRDAILDATVPNWRFAVRGEDAIRTELSRWYADPGEFQTLERTPLPHGELVEFTLTWIEDATPHTCHQAHIFAIEDGHIAADRVWCGGRWSASLMAEMSA